MKSLNEKIREARISLDMTQAELGEIINVSPRMIIAYESGDTKPSERTIHKLASGLLVSKQYLLSDDCENPYEDLDEEQIKIYKSKELQWEKNLGRKISRGTLTQKQEDCENPNECLDEKKRRSDAEKRVREMLVDNTALFAGGELTQKQKDNYFKALMAAYEACRDASENKESE